MGMHLQCLPQNTWPNQWLTLRHAAYLIVQDLSKLTITELKARLKAHRLPLSGKKADLVVRLSGTTAEPEAQAVAHVSSPQASTREGSGEVAEASAAASGEDAAKVAATFATKEAASRGAADAGDAAAQAPQPGTQQLDKVASAEVRSCIAHMPCSIYCKAVLTAMTHMDK